jgi:hypothetical protein
MKLWLGSQPSEQRLEVGPCSASPRIICAGSNSVSAPSFYGVARAHLCSSSTDLRWTCAAKEERPLAVGEVRWREGCVSGGGRCRGGEPDRASWLRRSSSWQNGLLNETEKFGPDKWLLDSLNSHGVKNTSSGTTTIALEHTRASIYLIRREKKIEDKTRAAAPCTSRVPVDPTRAAAPCTSRAPGPWAAGG